MTIARVFDARGNITSETRTIATRVYATTYTYDAADRVLSITYPSGRIVTYARDSMGRISSVSTKQTATAATVSLATSIDYMPISRLVKSFNYGNGLNDWNIYTLDYETDLLGTYDGPTSVCNVAHTRTDGLNLTNTWDTVAPANNQSFWYTPSNRLQNADGPWGQKTFFYDGVGNRTFESTIVGGITTTDNFQYPSTSNRVSTVVRGASTIRTLTYDAAGNIATDARSGTTYGYTYNRRNRLQAVSAGGITQATYVYDANEQIAIRDRHFVGASVPTPQPRRPQPGSRTMSTTSSASCGSAATISHWRNGGRRGCAGGGIHASPEELECNIWGA